MKLKNKIIKFLGGYTQEEYDNSVKLAEKVEEYFKLKYNKEPVEKKIIYTVEQYKPQTFAVDVILPAEIPTEIREENLRDVFIKKFKDVIMNYLIIDEEHDPYLKGDTLYRAKLILCEKEKEYI